MSDVKCHCGKVAKIPKGTNPSSVGDVAKVTGFHPMFCTNGELRYYCSECWEKAKVLTAKLVEVLGTERPYLPSMKR